MQISRVLERIIFRRSFRSGFHWLALRKCHQFTLMPILLQIVPSSAQPWVSQMTSPPGRSRAEQAREIPMVVCPLTGRICSGARSYCWVSNRRSRTTGPIAQEATENAVPEEIKRLEEIIRRQEMEVKLGTNPTRSDADFHYLLSLMTKNVVLERLDLALFDFMGKKRRRYLQSEDRKRESLSGHHRILKTIREKDRDGARLARLQHLRNQENILFTGSR